MPLTEKQVEQLFEFTKKKYVQYYDLQVELVDHLAESIEEEMEKDPSIGFEKALEKVYKTFGLFGFGKIVQEKEAAMRKQSKKMWLRELRQFFTIPKIFLTLTIFVSALIIGQYVHEVTRMVAVLVFWIIFTVIEIKNLKQVNKKRTRKLLCLSTSEHATVGSFLFPYWIMIPSEIQSHWFFAILITFIFVVEAAVIEVNKKIRERAMLQYPEAFA